uniref:Pseudouridine synthase n=2 Tax=Acrobeloides nanus TaxID=290746 RepID=A0A914CAU0_9BILA
MEENTETKELQTNSKKRKSVSNEYSPFEPKKRRKNKEATIPPPSEDDMPLNIPFRVTNGNYKTTTKRRWVGRKIAECFREEFLAYDDNYSYVACKMGRVFVNGKQCTDPEYELQHNDTICHISHRHEPPIMDAPIEFIENNENLLVINKPASMPVHSCAQYKIHTVVGMLWTRYGISGLRLIHRLDRATSGVLIFARNYETDIELKQAIQSNKMKKEYVCKVEGVFPSEEVFCDEPIGRLINTMGLQCTRPDGKPAKSVFRRLWTDGTNSVISAVIETGRTHQIRVHLQYLGYPILNDMFYNHEAWGPFKGRGANYGKPFEQLVKDIEEAHKTSNWHLDKNPTYLQKLELIRDESIEPENLANFGANGLLNRPDFDPICLNCNITRKIPTLDYFRMFLHCRRYVNEKFNFETPLPDWAIEPKVNDHFCC